MQYIYIIIKNVIWEILLKIEGINGTINLCITIFYSQRWYDKVASRGNNFFSEMVQLTLYIYVYIWMYVYIIYSITTLRKAWKHSIQITFIFFFFSSFIGISLYVCIYVCMHVRIYVIYMLCIYITS